MSLKCIIFDMDGTLTQTNQLIFDSFNFIVQKYQGKILTPAEITSYFGPPEEGALIPIVGEERLPQAMDEYLSFYRSNHRRLAKLYPGIREVLNDVKQRGKLLALFTGKGIHTTTITLEEFGLKDLFDSVVTGNDVVNHKPSAEGIQKILDQFNLKPEEAVMVGDSVSDIKASRSAGVRIVAVLWDSYAKDRVLQMETDFVFHDVTEFHRWLREQLD
ncbi:MAG TPA: HAD-IA family hydrolase [Bacteroidota bacterium]|nr:HAD-IA family hydrolase [Bacteroidota bacterium]